ncbi:major facilitator superfamily domain-containing protein [Dipodascopsis tothii]|uniref:major facilitator superfamily domain-containing protein n=1 Tax=Dipodascopsis tothii TaxID=44089 RepID=UPI0034CFF8F2
MVLDILRDSFFGQVVYYASSHKIFRYAEDQPDYVIPAKYLGDSGRTSSVSTEVTTAAQEKPDDAASHSIAGSAQSEATIQTQTPVAAADLEKNAEPEGDIAYQEAHDTDVPEGKIVVDWDGPDDPLNPYNWSFGKRAFIIFQICYLTTSVYIGSAIYTPGITEMRTEFGVGVAPAVLALSLFVFAYGLGPMILSPLSENPIIGRTNIYIISLFIFVVLEVPVALSKNLASLLVLRFITGFFSSPALATGGATIGDIVPLSRVPMGIALWGCAAVCGPSLGPLIGGVFTQVLNWRWAFWFLLMISGSSLVMLTFFLPETNGQTILYRKAQRLRRLTGNPNITSRAEIEVSKMNFKEMMFDSLWRPIEIAFKEPIVLAINSYIALVYAVMYLWFEAFPIVMEGLYGFNLIQTGVAYSGILVGCYLSGAMFVPLIYYRFTRPLEQGKAVVPESLMTPAIYGAVWMPIGIFIFAFTSTASVHWIVPIIGTAIFAYGAFFLFQSMFNYLGMSFYRFMASVFAGNALFRSCFAAAFPLFASPMYNNLATSKFPVAWGCSIVGFLAVAMVSIPVVLRVNGKNMRARSKYAN